MKKIASSLTKASLALALAAGGTALYAQDTGIPPSDIPPTTDEPAPLPGDTDDPITDPVPTEPAPGEPAPPPPTREPIDEDGDGFDDLTGEPIVDDGVGPVQDDI